MDAVSDVSSSGPNAQIQAAAASKALDVQKQEGEAAIDLIQSAVDSTEVASSPNPTGTIIDIEA